jgi:hypothetical protein
MRPCKACGGLDHSRATSRLCLRPRLQRDNAWRLFQAGGRAWALLWWLIQNVKALRSNQTVARLPTDRLEDRYIEREGRIVVVKRALSSEILFQALVHVIGTPEQRERHAQYFMAKWALGRAADDPEGKGLALRPALPPEMVARVLPFIWGDNPLVEPLPSTRGAAWLDRPISPRNGRPGRRRTDCLRSRPLQVTIPVALSHATLESPLLLRIARFERQGPAFFGGAPLAVAPPTTYKPNEKIEPVCAPSPRKRLKIKPRPTFTGYWFHNQAARTLLDLPIAETAAGALKVFVVGRWAATQPAEIRVSLAADVTVDDVLLFLSTAGVRLGHAAILRSSSSFEWVDGGALFKDVVPRPIDWGSPALCPAGGVPHYSPFPIFRVYAADANLSVSLRCEGVCFGDQGGLPIQGVIEARRDWRDVLF